MLSLHIHARTSERPRISACPRAPNRRTPPAARHACSSAHNTRSPRRRRSAGARTPPAAPRWHRRGSSCVPRTPACTHARTQGERLCARLAGAHARVHARACARPAHRGVNACASHGGSPRPRAARAHRRAQTRTHRKSFTRCSAFFAACPAIPRAVPSPIPLDSPQIRFVDSKKKHPKKTRRAERTAHFFSRVGVVGARVLGAAGRRGRRRPARWARWGPSVHVRGACRVEAARRRRQQQRRPYKHRSPLGDSGTSCGRTGAPRR